MNRDLFADLAGVSALTLMTVMSLWLPALLGG